MLLERFQKAFIQQLSLGCGINKLWIFYCTHASEDFFNQFFIATLIHARDRCIRIGFRVSDAEVIRILKYMGSMFCMIDKPVVVNGSQESVTDYYSNAIF